MEKEYKQIEGSKYYTTSKKYILGIFQLTKIPITEKYIFVSRSEEHTSELQSH